MLEFCSQEIRGLNGRLVEAAVLHTPDNAIGIDRDVVIRDGVDLELSVEIAHSVLRAVEACMQLEQQNMAVDCTVFGALMLGGNYSAVNSETYSSGLWRRFTFGQWLVADACDITDEPSLVMFGNRNKRLLRDSLDPIHTAVRLPSVADTYIQKLGPKNPIAITSIGANFDIFDVRAAASIDQITVNQRSRTVLSYKSARPRRKPIAVYESMPGYLSNRL